jgi:hypothetical protein
MLRPLSRREMLLRSANGFGASGCRPCGTGAIWSPAPITGYRGDTGGGRGWLVQPAAPAHPSRVPHEREGSLLVTDLTVIPARF